MNISYQRSPLKGYMVIRGEEKDIGYQEQMLQEHAIPFLLPFYAMAVNLELEVWYDITGKRSLRDMITQEGVTMENVKHVLEGLTQAFYQFQQYLICQEDVYVDPDTVYFDRNDPNQISLCFCPVVHPDLQEQLLHLMEFFVEQVDHSQQKITQLCYELYEIARDPVSMEQLAEKVRKSYGMDVESGEENIPSENRSIVIRESNMKIPNPKEEEEKTLQEEDAGEYELEKTEKSEKSSRLHKKWQDLMAGAKKEGCVKFPLLAKLFRKRSRKSGEEEEDLEGEDFIFDPQMVLQQKTQLLHPAEEAGARGEHPQQAKLVYDGNGTESSYVLNKSHFSIGSMEAGNDAILHSDVVSRHHARITKQEEGYFLEDLNSTNGTYLNGDLVPYNVKVPLHSMDQILFADVAYHFV